MCTGVVHVYRSGPCVQEWAMCTGVGRVYRKSGSHVQEK